MKTGLLCRASRHPIEEIKYTDKNTGQPRELFRQRMLLIDPQYPEESTPFNSFIPSKEEAYVPGVDYHIPTTAFQTDERGNLTLNSRFRIEPVAAADSSARASSVLKTA
jgi:hypothetical protein